MGLKALARKVLDKNKPLNMALNSGRNFVQSGGVQIEQAGPQDWRHFFGERAAVLEYDHELPKPEAERQAFEWCIVEWLNQHPSPSEPDRCAWCDKPEDAGMIVPFGVEATWLHHACWKPWHQERSQDATSAMVEMGIGGEFCMAPDKTAGKQQ